MNNTGVYTILNKVTNKSYVGSAINITARWLRHKSDLLANKHHSKYLQAAINKYGIENFSLDVLCLYSKKDLLYYEQVCINLLNPEYNILKIAGSCLGRKHSEETKLKLSKIQKGIPQGPKSEETKLKLSLALKGKPKSEETKIKLSKPRSEETKLKMSASATNRHHSEETKIKMSEAAKCRKRKSN